MTVGNDKAMLVDGATLRRIFAWQDPFRDGAPERRATILAANANFPLEIEVRAFCLAAADWPGSPLIVQFSHGALKIVGGQGPLAAASGARLARSVLEHYVRESGARYISAALDHFKIPAYPGDGVEGTSRAVRLARGAVDDALEALRPVSGAEVPDGELRTYVTYLSSPSFATFKREFGAAMTALQPAWAMIDTERIPPILNFALTRDVVEFTRRGLGFADVMLEAEYGATGSAGEPQEYQPLAGEALAGFAEEVASFIAYTGADGISYPVGMEHAAPRGEKHEPDEVRLQAVQTRILRVTGRYVPFAQHGATGAARLALGLVGKNNMSTHFLVVAANKLADRITADADRIRAGVKEACGTGLYTSAAEAVREAVVEELKEAGTFGSAPELDAFLAGQGLSPA